MAIGGPLSAKIVFNRDAGNDIGIRGLDLSVDGEFAVNLAFGKCFEMEVTAGRHSVLASNTLYKQVQDFELAEGEVASFQVSNVMTGLGKLLLSLGGGVYKVELRRLS